MTERLEHALGWNEDDWSDFEIRLVIEAEHIVDKKHPRGHWVGGPFSWKRARQVVQFQGHASLGLTSEAKAWAKSASSQLHEQWQRVFRDPIPKCIKLNAAIVSYHPTRRFTDASNLYQGPEDVLQVCQPKCKPNCRKHAGVIEDDSAIESHDGSARAYDKQRPRVEIILTPATRVGVNVQQEMKL